MLALSATDGGTRTALGSDDAAGVGSDFMAFASRTPSAPPGAFFAVVSGPRGSILAIRTVIRQLPMARAHITLRKSLSRTGVRQHGTSNRTSAP